MNFDDNIYNHNKSWLFMKVEIIFKKEDGPVGAC